MTPCYYCDIRSVGNCKTCIHSYTYEEPTTLKELTDEDLDKLIKNAEQLGHRESYIVGLIDGFNYYRTVLEKEKEK